MTIDVATFTAAGALVAFVSGLLLVFAWTQYDGGRAALRLAASHMLGSIAIALLAIAGNSNPDLGFLAQPIFAVAALLALSAVLIFERKERPLLLFLAGAIAAGTLVALYLLGAPPNSIRVMQLGVTAPAFLIAAAVLWHGRSERLSARYPLIALFTLHALTNGIGLAEAILRQAYPSGIPALSDWYGLIHFESVIYLIGTALFMVALLKERSESGHRIASLTDPLTGMPNRRAFFYACERMLERCRRSGEPATLLAIDLDRFKAINDTFGHAIGDRVLQTFAAVVQEQFRHFDISGRLGGEEFAILLPRTHAREGAEVADRLRRAFSEAARVIDGHQIGATLSVGVAVVFGSEITIGEVLERADAALYRAKLNGRDRVELDGGGNSVRLVQKAR